MSKFQSESIWHELVWLYRGTQNSLFFFTSGYIQDYENDQNWSTIHYTKIMFYLHSLSQQNSNFNLVNMAIKILKYQLNLQPRRNKKLLAKFYSGTKCLFRTIKFYSSFTISRSNTLGIIDCYIPGLYFITKNMTFIFI